MTAKRFAASTLEHDNEFDSSLFDSFHRKTPITRQIDFKDTRVIGKNKKPTQKKSRPRAKTK